MCFAAGAIDLPNQSLRPYACKDASRGPMGILARCFDGQMQAAPVHLIVVRMRSHGNSSKAFEL